MRFILTWINVFLKSTHLLWTMETDRHQFFSVWQFRSHSSPDTLSSHIQNTSVVKLTYSSDVISCIVEDRSMHDKIMKQEQWGPSWVYFYRHGRRKWNGKAILHYAWPERKRGGEDRKKTSTSSSGTTDKKMFLYLVCMYVYVHFMICKFWGKKIQ